MKFLVLTLLFKNLLKNYNDESVEVFSLKSNALSSFMLEYEYCSFGYPSLRSEAISIDNCIYLDQWWLNVMLSLVGIRKEAWIMDAILGSQ